MRQGIFFALLRLEMGWNALTGEKEALAKKYGISLGSLPRHVGVIMDGNGRWAKARRMPRLAGHKKGVQRVDETTEFACRIGIEALTLFAFSNENWKRPEDEVNGLMSLLRWYLRAERKKILDNNIVFGVIGDRRKLSSDILRQIEELEALTKNNSGLVLTIALSYGSRSEIVRAASRLAADVQAGRIYPADIDEELFAGYLDTASLPPLDLLVRTSGELRLSNFLLYQAAYAELSFEEAKWPDFTAAIFASHLKEYARRKRRFGLVPEQIPELQAPRPISSHAQSTASFVGANVVPPGNPLSSVSDVN